MFFFRSIYHYLVFYYRYIYFLFIQVESKLHENSILSVLLLPVLGQWLARSVWSRVSVEKMNPSCET